MTFDTLEEAEKAKECNGTEICDQAIRVSFSKPRAPRGGGGGGRGAGGPRVCFKCQKEGHMSRECPGVEAGNEAMIP